MRAICVTVAAVLASTGAAAPFYLSDFGYIDNTVSPPICYLPHLSQPGNSSRQMPIGPENGNAVGAQWGDIAWINPRDPITGAGYWDSLIDSLIVAGRAVTITLVEKTWDAARGIWIDANPVTGGLAAFSGIALGWSTDGDSVTLHIRDNLAVLEQPLQDNFYSGAGGAGGTTDIANQPIPKTRGVVTNVTPILVDPAKNTYQISDASVALLTVYEGGIAGFSLTSNFATYALLAAATLTSGQYATCLAQGYFRLGTTPVYDITCDLRGNFPSGATPSDTIDIVLGLLEEDCGIASGSINTASIGALQTLLASLYGTNRSGFYTGSDNPTPIDLLSLLLNAYSCSVGTDLNGKVDIFQLVSPNPVGTTVAEFTTAHILDGAQHVDLPDGVVIPNWRRSVSFQPNGTTQSGNTLKPGVTQAQRQVLAKPYAIATWSSTGGGSVRALYPTSLDAPIVLSGLIDGSAAQSMATNLGALWGVQRHLYDLSLPRAVILPSSGPAVELGAIIGVTFPIGKLAARAVCEVVGMDPDFNGDTVTLRVFL